MGPQHPRVRTFLTAFMQPADLDDTNQEQDNHSDQLALTGGVGPTFFEQYSVHYVLVACCMFLHFGLLPEKGP